MNLICKLWREKLFCFCVALCAAGPLQAAVDLQTLADSLDRMIDEKQQFVRIKQERINRIKNQLKIKGLSYDRQYEINYRLYDEYKKFEIDSAIHYATRNVEVARKMERKDREWQSELQLSLVYSMCGMFRDAERLLHSIDRTKLPPGLVTMYYETYGRLWEYYSASVAHDSYRKFREAYEDSLFKTMDPTSADYKLRMSYYYTAHDTVKAGRILHELLQTEEVGTPMYAMITHSYAMFFRRKKDSYHERYYFMLSAIADIRNATRENTSLQELAIIQYGNGNLAEAFKFTQSSIDDVVSSGIRFRAMEMSKFYSIINAAYQKEEADSKSHLVFFLIFTSISLFLVVVLVVGIYIQMKKTLRIKQALSESNEKLRCLNGQLNEMNSRLNGNNTQLREVNDMKEQYIAQFFDVCSNYISKMEKYQNTLFKLASKQSYEELVKKIKATGFVEEELNALYVHFDSIFLSLYPTFVADFNALLKEDGKILLKPDVLLNKELRIYALLRLGITDSGKIANFLRCSTSTIYNYRTRLRNKALDRAEFENEVMRIGMIRSENDKNKPESPSK